MRQTGSRKRDVRTRLSFIAHCFATVLARDHAKSEGRALAILHHERRSGRGTIERVEGADGSGDNAIRLGNRLSDGNIGREVSACSSSRLLSMDRAARRCATCVDIRSDLPDRRHPRCRFCFACVGGAGARTPELDVVAGGKARRCRCVGRASSTEIALLTCSSEANA
jgi:hypothetical protein